MSALELRRQRRQTRTIASYRAALGAAPLLLALSGCNAPEPPAPTAGDSPRPEPRWQREVLVPGGPFHGIHGVGFDAEGRLLAGSVVGAAIYAIDPDSGAVEIYRGPPNGMADDIALAPDGTLAWTGFLTGEVWVEPPGGAPIRVAEGLPGANSLAFTADGRLFFTQVFLGDALYEADLTGTNAPRKIMADMGGLNGFEFGPDGGLYGPLWFKGQIARVDVDAATLEVVAEGFEIPAAVNFDSQGTLYTVDTARGLLLQVDREAGEHAVIAEVAPAIDNFVVAADDTIFLSNMADNAIIHIDPATGATRTVVDSPLAVAADIALSEDGGSIWVADVFSLRRVDLASGAVSEIARQYADELENPLAVGAGAGRVVTTSWSAGVIQEFDARTGESLALHHGMPTPFDAVPLPGGEVLFVDFAGGRLVRAGGEHLADQTVIAEGLAAPVALVMDGDGAVLVSESGGGRVVRIALETGAVEVVVDGLDAPEGIAIAPDGAIAVAEVGAGRILRVDPADGTRTVLDEAAPIGFPAPAGAPTAYIPTGLAVAPDGSVVYSADQEAGIYRLVRR